MSKRALHLVLASALLACNARVDVGGADSGSPDAGTADAGRPHDAAPPDSPLPAPDGGYYEAPPWVECPPNVHTWTDPLAEAAAERFFSRARAGDPCLFDGACSYRRDGSLPIPGLPLEIDLAYVGCSGGRLNVTTHRVDCGGELADAPWSGGDPWADEECVGEDPDCSSPTDPRYRCIRAATAAWTSRPAGSSAWSACGAATGHAPTCSPAAACGTAAR